MVRFSHHAQEVTHSALTGSICPVIWIRSRHHTPRVPDILMHSVTQVWERWKAHCVCRPCARSSSLALLMASSSLTSSLPGGEPRGVSAGVDDEADPAFLPEPDRTPFVSCSLRKASVFSAWFMAAPHQPSKRKLLLQGVSNGTRNAPRLDPLR